MIHINQGRSLAGLTWWKIGGPADFFCEPLSVNEVGEALLWAHQKGCPTTVLSGGSNVLISDEGIEGLVISMSRLNQLSVTQTPQMVTVEALAGTPKSELTKIFLREKLEPAVFLCGLPGDVGGGVVMNAGVSEAIVPREFVEIIDYVDVLRVVDGHVEELRYQKSELKWSYRKCTGWEPGVIIRAGLSWPFTPNPDVMNRVRSATRSRLERQPLNQPSCGSVFKNPDGAKAGALIEGCGLKGFQLGQAQVSTKHANFIVNLGGAQAKDVHQIIQHVQSVVFEQTGYSLECEVRRLGRW